MLLCYKLAVYLANVFLSSALSLFEYSMTVCYKLCSSPLRLLSLFDAALVEAQTVILADMAKKQGLVS